MREPPNESSLRLKTKKPAAGGGAAGFSKRTEQRLGGGVPLFRKGPWEEERTLPHEALREEVHRFDDLIIALSRICRSEIAALQLCRYCIAIGRRF
jgi:hypothetical protein